MPAPRLDHTKFYLNCHLTEGYDHQDLKVESGDNNNKGLVLMIIFPSVVGSAYAGGN